MASRTVRELLKRKVALFSIFVLVVVIITAFIGPLVAPGDPAALAAQRFLGIGEEGFVLGTDHLGRDIFTRLLVATSQTAVVAFAAAGIALVLATVVGVVSAWLGGWVDSIVQRFVDALMAMPTLVLLIVMISVVGAGITQLIIALGLLTAIGGSRVVRSAALAIKNEPYLEAASALGAKPTRVVFRHLLPNVLATVIVVVTLNVGRIIIAESSLSFLGLGVIDPATPTWGQMLLDARTGLLNNPQVALWPGFAISVTVFAVNMLGDAFRDIFDPRLRGR